MRKIIGNRYMTETDRQKQIYNESGIITETENTGNGQITEMDRRRETIWDFGYLCCVRI